jgi:hypothetical protein
MNVQQTWQHLMPQQHSYDSAQSKQLCNNISEHTAYIFLDGTLLTAYQITNCKQTCQNHLLPVFCPKGMQHLPPKY